MTQATPFSLQALKQDIELHPRSAEKMNWRSQWKRRKAGTRQLSASHVDPPSIYLTLWELWTKQSDDRELVVDWSKIVRKVNKK